MLHNLVNENDIHESQTRNKFVCNLLIMKKFLKINILGKKNEIVIFKVKHILRIDTSDFIDC